MTRETAIATSFGLVSRERPSRDDQITTNDYQRRRRMTEPGAALGTSNRPLEHVKRPAHAEPASGFLSSRPATFPLIFLLISSKKHRNSAKMSLFAQICLRAQGARGDFCSF